MAWTPRGGTPRRTAWQEQAVREREDRTPLADEAETWLRRVAEGGGGTVTFHFLRHPSTTDADHIQWGPATAHTLDPARMPTTDELRQRLWKHYRDAQQIDPWPGGPPYVAGYHWTEQWLKGRHSLRDWTKPNDWPLWHDYDG